MENAEKRMALHIMGRISAFEKHLQADGSFLSVSCSDEDMDEIIQGELLAKFLRFLSENDLLPYDRIFMLHKNIACQLFPLSFEKKEC
jgi:hypothetical protein